MKFAFGCLLFLCYAGAQINVKGKELDNTQGKSKIRFLPKIFTKTDSRKANNNSNKTRSCDCGWNNSGRIVGGEATYPNEYPWMVRLHNGCGGSIITMRHIITGAHCTHGKSSSDILVSVGIHSIAPEYWQFPKTGVNRNEQIYKIEKILSHGSFTYDNALNFDVSILVTAKNIEFNKYVGPVCLPYRKINLEGKYVKVLGWGSTAGTGIQGELKELDQKVVPLSECKTIIVKDHKLCTFSFQRSPCYGDSGGPVVYLDPIINRYTLVGMVSKGENRCEGEKPLINIDVFSFELWIRRVIFQYHPEAEVCNKRRR